MKRLYWGIGVILLSVLIGRLSFIYNSHSTINKILDLSDKDMTTIHFAHGKVAIHDTGTELQAFYLKKGFLGWKKVLMTTQYKNIRLYDQLFSFFNVDGQGFMFGYFPSPNIQGVTFTDPDGTLSITSTLSDAKMWFIPFNEAIPIVDKNNLSILMKDGREIGYPFEGLENRMLITPEI